MRVTEPGAGVSLNRRDGPAASQYPPDGSESRGRLHHVLQHEAEEDMVEALIAKRQVKQVRDLELDIPVAVSLNSRTGLLERVRRSVHGNNPCRRVPRSEDNRDRKSVV